jgi:hypothetical protein
MEEGVFQPVHILVIGILCPTAVVVAVVLVVLSIIRNKRQTSDRLSSLEAENARLREEIDRLKGGKA